MNFGEAIEAMKNGKMVTRSGWNGKGMYLWLLPAARVKAEWCKEPHLKALAEENGGEVECLASIRMKTADNKVLTGWLASQTDILSEDWEIYEENDKTETDMQKYVTHNDWNYCGIRFLRAIVSPRCWEDGKLNGNEDDNDNPQMPCIENGRWNILIDIKTGQVINWKIGNTAVVYYKVCDEGDYTVYDNNMNKINEYDGYVPKIMAFDDDGYGYGDYVDLAINKEGYIANWPDNERIEWFIDQFLENCD